MLTVCVCVCVCCQEGVGCVEAVIQSELKKLLHISHTVRQAGSETETIRFKDNESFAKKKKNKSLVPSQRYAELKHLYYHC